MTPLEILYQTVYNNSITFTVIFSIVAGLIFTVVSFFIKKWLVAVPIVLMLLCIFVIGTNFAQSQALYSVSTGWEQAKNEKATYIERLHGVWVSYEVTPHQCHSGDSSIDGNNLGETGCQYASSYSYCYSRDSKGKCTSYHYRYTPWFNYEVDYSASLNVYTNNHVVFAEHYAPEDYKNHLYGGGGLFGFSHSETEFNFKPPQDWARIKQAIDSGNLLPGSVYHNYFNWVMADDYSLYKTRLPHINNYQSQGLLPTINKIHDSNGHPMDADIHGNVSGTGYDYDVVQFLGMKVNPDIAARWQNSAALWASMAGPKLQASLLLAFAPADKIGDNQKDWIQSTKSYLMQESVFGRYMLPKNLVLIMCGVDPSLQNIQWCQMETGMFRGNEGAETDVSSLQPFPFTPESVFGQIQESGVKQKVTQLNPDSESPQIVQIKPIITFSNGLIDSILRDSRPGHGFHRISMSQFEYMRTNVTPDQSQVDQLKADAQAHTVWLSIGIWGVLLIFYVIGGVLYAKSKESYGYRY